MLRVCKTENGLVRGLPAADNRITSFKGIPFAAPPVGKNRWRAPQPAQDWEGIRDAFEFGPIGIQDTPGLGTDIYCREWHVDPEIPMSEDCLYLNIWTPAKKTDEKLPVLVWFFGGGLQWGYPSEMEFDGERLARRGIIVVSVNYRLASLGFLCHPEITKENPDAPANFGHLDQQAGLFWVKRNIANFGGDPDNISIGGQSAGGGSVLAQLQNPKNFDVIKSAAIFSGIIKISDPKFPIRVNTPLSEAEKRGEDFFKFLGVSTLDEARALDAIYIRDKYAEYAKDHIRFMTIQDDKFIFGDPIELFEQGKRANVPVFAGHTFDEFGNKFTHMMENGVKEAFLANEKTLPGIDNYYYVFDVDIPGKDFPGTFHSVDLWFFFETLAKCSRPFVGRHYDVARQMANYWVNFIKTGDPNGRDADGQPMPEWKPYNDSTRAEMWFTAKGASPIKEEPHRPVQVYNPYMPSWEYVPDGEPHVFGDRVYVYGSHDVWGGETFCLGDYVCWSAPVNNLKDWRLEGTIYRKDQDPLNPDGHMCLYAPDVTQGPDGRYYLYYVLDKVSVVSVAVCDTPAGEYEFYGYVHDKNGVRLGDRPTDEPQFDPGVLTEGDKTYLYTGFCGHGDKSRHGAMATALGPDMLTIEEDPKFIVPGAMYSQGTGYEGHAFFEAPSIRKVGDKYCFVYSSQVMHELCYAMSDEPTSGYTYGGVVVSNCDLGIDSYKPADLPMAYGANNHGGMVKIGDQWYIFYHRHTNSTWFQRQGCAEPIEITENGTKVPQVEITSCGLNGGPLAGIGYYPAYIACNMFTDVHSAYVGGNPADGANRQYPKVIQQGVGVTASEGYVANMTKNATVGFKYFAFDQVKKISIYARGYANGVFEVRTKWDGEVLATLPVSSANIWTESTADIELDGVSALYLTFNGTGTANLKGVRFSK